MLWTLYLVVMGLTSLALLYKRRRANEARSLMASASCLLLNKTQESINCMPAVEMHATRPAESRLSLVSPIG